MGVAPGSCFTCHNGGQAKGKPNNHLPTAMSCDSCHRTTSWTPANFTHNGIAPNTCATCHNGTSAKGKSANHFVTTKSCDTCHRTTGWTPVTNYNHTAPTYVRHSGGTSCNDCHKTKNEVIVWKFPAFKPDCAGCHANDFKPDRHVKVDSPRILYTVNDLRNCTSACHVYTNSSLTTVKTSIPSHHRSTSGGW